MSGNNLFASLNQLLIKYKQLPYLALKKSSRWYLIPHKPHRPKLFHFRIATSAIKQHSLKYNQYFSSDKLWEKVSQKFEQKVLDSQATSQIINQTQFKQKWDEYFKNARQYYHKYKEPYQIMAVNSYCLFKREYFKKLKEERQKLLQNEQSTTQKQKEKKKNKQQGIKSRRQGIIKLNNLKVSKIWLNMSTQEKQVYDKKLQEMRQENEVRIKQFIKNHQVPVVKRYTVMSRYLAKYAVIYQLKITDPKIYQKYRELPEQEKKSLSEQAKEMNRESRLRMQQFLKRWNISKQQLSYIIEISDKYNKTKGLMIKNKLGFKNKKEKLSIEEDDEQDEDYNQYQLDEEMMDHDIDQHQQK